MQLSEAAILIVDDEPQLVRIFSAWMRRCGCAHVYTAGNGAEALKVLDSQHIDVMVSDVRMPIMDGVALLESIAQRNLYLPAVIFVSGFNELDLPRAYSIGVEAILPKPITLPELEASVKHCLAKREDLWSSTDLPAPSVVAALRASGPTDTVFGRGGVCATSDSFLARVRVQFHLAYDPLQVAAGYGIVRWFSRTTLQAGIEFEYLEPNCRSAVLQLLASQPLVAFIPAASDLRNSWRANRVTLQLE